MGAGVGLEGRLFLKAQKPRRQNSGKRIPGCVVILNGRVVILPRCINSIFSTSKFGLDVHKKLVRFELRIVFLQAQKPTDRSTKTIVRIDDSLFLLGGFVTVGSLTSCRS